MRRQPVLILENVGIKKHATFMILGRVCTRKCTFCNVATGTPNKIDKNEPEKIARAVNALALNM